MGDLKGALESLQRAANMRLSVLSDYKDTASSFFKLSVLQKEAGDLKSALESVQVSLMTGAATEKALISLVITKTRRPATIGLVKCSMTWETLKGLWILYKGQET